MGEGIIRAGQNDLVDDFAMMWSQGQVVAIHLPSLLHCHGPTCQFLSWWGVPQPRSPGWGNRYQLRLR